MNAQRYECPKCSNPAYEVGEMRAAGGFWSKIFDVQGSKFTRITCTRCKYTEFYMADTSMLGNIFDFFTN
ncbi:MAG: zinc ribbon domain-containing protein [Candidatus Zixiibacteriota bacterium]|nr:MAG: zinc ribbon domain-containing protein [candidate division Zixibacteria bacterium]